MKIPGHCTGRILCVPNGRQGFTLIELLIVVAIIGILAAVAIPNFLQARMRAMVSRTQSDLRCLATALECYHVDHDEFPYVLDQGGIEWQMPVGFPPHHTDGPAGLTTPIAYITSPLWDPFQLSRDRLDNPLLFYERCGFGFDSNGGFLPIKPVRVPVDANGTLEGTAPDYREDNPARVPAAYAVYSVGPSCSHRVFNPDGSILVRSRFSMYNRYDPTNGVMSQGNIIRFPGGRSFP